MASLERAIEHVGRVPVRLPDPIVRGGGLPPLTVAWIVPMRGEQHLFAGLLPLLLAEQDGDDAAHYDEWLAMARSVCVVCLRVPECAFKAADGKLCIDDLTDANIAAVYSAAVNITHSVYAGIDRTAEIDDEVAEAQHEVSVFYYRIMRNFPAYDLEKLLHLDREQLSKLGAILTAGAEWEREEAAKRGEAGHE